jgi:hypothetical protein
MMSTLQSTFRFKFIFQKIYIEIIQGYYLFENNQYKQNYQLSASQIGWLEGAGL